MTLQRLALVWRDAWAMACVALFALGASPASGASPADAGPRDFSITVVPQMPAKEIDRIWQPVLRRLGERTGLRFTLKVAPSIPHFEHSLLLAEPDFAFMNPYHQVLAFRAHGYVPLVRDETPLSGILVVRADGPIRTLRDLDGQTLAFPAPNAFGASLWMRALLAEREGLTINPHYVRTHGNVYRQVLAGGAVAGGGIHSTLANERPEIRDGLRILLETPRAAPHPLSAHPRVPAATRAAIVAAVLDMAGDPADATLLRAIPMGRPVAADHDRDYQPLEAYRLDKFIVLEP
jgi:phosphonate transport system substrate-binding protein